MYFNAISENSILRKISEFPLSMLDCFVSAWRVVTWKYYIIPSLININSIYMKAVFSHSSSHIVVNGSSVREKITC